MVLTRVRKQSETLDLQWLGLSVCVCVCLCVSAHLVLRGLAVGEAGYEKVKTPR